MDFSEPQHKKVIGYIYIIFSAFGLLSVLFYDYFMEFILDIAAREDPSFNEDALWVFEIVSSVIWGLAIIFLIPRLIIGFGLAQGRKWANVPGLVYGIISLINIPLGTLLGIYAILAFTAKPKEELDY